MNQETHTYATIDKTYPQKSIRARIEAFFLDNVGKVVTREQIIEIAKDPETGKDPLISTTPNLCLVCVLHGERHKPIQQPVIQQFFVSYFTQDSAVPSINRASLP